MSAAEHLRPEREYFHARDSQLATLRQAKANGSYSGDPDAAVWSAMSELWPAEQRAYEFEEAWDAHGGRPAFSDADEGEVSSQIDAGPQPGSGEALIGVDTVAREAVASSPDKWPREEARELPRGERLSDGSPMSVESTTGGDDLETESSMDKAESGSEEASKDESVRTRARGQRSTGRRQKRPRQASAKQVAANRERSLRATGPVTPQGKDRTSWNALKHGGSARTDRPIPFGSLTEDAGEIEKYKAAIVASLFTPTEALRAAAREVASAMLTLERVARAEGAILKQVMDRTCTVTPAHRELEEQERDRNIIAETMSWLERVEKAISDHDGSMSWRQVIVPTLGKGQAEQIVRLLEDMHELQIDMPGRWTAEIEPHTESGWRTVLHEQLRFLFGGDLAAVGKWLESAAQAADVQLMLARRNLDFTDTETNSRQAADVLRVMSEVATIRGRVDPTVNSALKRYALLLTVYENFGGAGDG